MGASDSLVSAIARLSCRPTSRSTSANLYTTPSLTPTATRYHLWHRARAPTFGNEPLGVAGTTGRLSTQRSLRGTQAAQSTDTEIVMSQNLISLALTADQLTAVEGALATLEQNLTGLIALQPAQRRSLTKMGDKSEVFCRQTLKLLQQNPQVVPPSLDVAEAAADLVAFDQIGSFLLRLTRLSARAEDTSTALGSDLMSFALEGYGLLKVSGKNQGLEDLRRDLGARFARGAARPTSEPAPAAA